MKRNQLLLICIVLLAAMVRLFALDRIPNGFIPEEVSTGWNAYSILKTGRDEWGTFLPLIFRETGGFKLALNSYLIVPFMAVFGRNELSVRLPTALAGILTVYLTYLLSKKIFHFEKAALTAALLLALNPWAISMSRYAVDVNLGIPLFLGGLLTYFKGKTHPKWLVLSAILFALTYYTYFNYVVFTFLFVAGLFMLERNYWLQRSHIRLVFIFFAIQCLFLLPYIVKSNLTTRFSQATSVAQIGIVNQINEHRQACLTTNPLWLCRMLYNKPVARVTEIVKNYVNHYSTTTFFLYGSKLGLSGMPNYWGFFYLFEFPLLILGIVYLLRMLRPPPFLWLWFFLYGVPSSLAAEAHVWRMLTILPLPQLVSSLGFIYLLKIVRSRVVRFIGVSFAAFWVLGFLVDYAGFFRYFQSMNAYYGFRDLYYYLSTVENQYDHIVVAPANMGFDQQYIYYLFYTGADPAKYQQGIEVERVVGEQEWVKVKRIGKWYFEGDVRNVIFSLPDKTLLVTDGQFNETALLPKKVMLPKLLHTVSFPYGDPAFKVVELTKNPHPEPF